MPYQGPKNCVLWPWEKSDAWEDYVVAWQRIPLGYAKLVKSQTFVQEASGSLKFIRWCHLAQQSGLSILMLCSMEIPKVIYRLVSN